ncbi:hypothetical protein EV361DRAFT_808265, partial [Lentinula raphanica]
MDDNGYRRPQFCFQPEHRQCDTHVLHLLKPGDRQIPVPIGPAIPRRDKPEVYQRYCRTMLMLFKPWRSASDLRFDNSQSWSTTFDDYKLTCSKVINDYMTNMQLLHECKDSRDDHFEQRQ